MKFGPDMQNHRAYKMLEVDFWIFDFFSEILPFLVKNPPFWKKNCKISEKNQKLKNLLPTIFRPYGSAYLVQISCF